MKAQLPQLTLAFLASLVFNATAATRYVDLNSHSPAAPYTNWATAATNIQDAVDAASNGDLVLVTNGIYNTGGRAVFGTMTNRAAVDKPVTVQSVNGPQYTVIQGRQVPGTTNGDGAIRCVFLADGAGLSGFTLTSGATRDWRGDYYYEQDGGGLWCESNTAVVSNCVVTGNSAEDGGGGASGGTLNNCELSGNSAGSGGGVEGSVLNHCTLTSNSASGWGGGAFRGRLDNCVLTGNSASLGGGVRFGALNNCTLTLNSAGWGGGVASDSSDSILNNCALIGNSARYQGGGAYYSTLNNCTLVSNQANGTFLGEGGGGAAYGTLSRCIVYFNTATNGANYWGSFLNYCCTAPQPSGTVGNITNAPLFIDPTLGNFRLQSNSPCLNAGLNVHASGPTDLDGNPRIVGGTVDIGAYEFQSPASVLSYAWAQQNGLPTDGSADFTDTDGDSANNWHEWRAGTIPANALSVFRIVSATNGASGLNVTWQSVSSRSYFLERATNLDGMSPFQSIATYVIGAPGTRTYTDGGATNGGPYFYRVGVH